MNLTTYPEIRARFDAAVAAMRAIGIAGSGITNARSLRDLERETQAMQYALTIAGSLAHRLDDHRYVVGGTFDRMTKLTDAMDRALGELVKAVAAEIDTQARGEEARSA